MGQNTKRIGTASEAAVIADLIVRQDLFVTLPFDDNSPYDVIVTADHRKLARVQIKTAQHLSSGSDVIRAPSSRSRVLVTETKTVARKYTSEFIDVLAGYCRICQRCIYFPAEQLREGGSVLYFRYRDAVNNQGKKTRKASDYADMPSHLVEAAASTSDWYAA